MTNLSNKPYPSTLNLEYFLILSNWSFQDALILLAYFSTKNSGSTDQNYLEKLYNYHHETYSDIFRRDCHEPRFPVKNLVTQQDEEAFDRYGEVEYFVSFSDSTICKAKFILWARERSIPIPDDFLEKLQKSIPFSDAENEEHFMANNYSQDDFDLGLTISSIDDADLRSKNPDVQGLAIRLYGALFAGIIITTYPKLKKEDLERELKKAGFKGDLEISTKVFSSIWRAIPETLKNKGRPPKA